MISLTASRKFRHGKQELFEAIDNIQKLGRVKKDLGNYSVARNETGLQIIDTSFSFLIMKFSTRLKYTARPDRYTELRQIKGRLKEYACTYDIREEGIESEVIITLSIKLPYGPIGFLLGLINKPIYGFRLRRELKTLEKLLAK